MRLKLFVILFSCLTIISCHPKTKNTSGAEFDPATAPRSDSQVPPSAKERTDIPEVNLDAIAKVYGQDGLDPATVQRLLDSYVPPSAKEMANIPEVDVDVVAKLYRQNKAEADKLYGNKLLKVRGTLYYGPTNEGFGSPDIYYVGLEHNREKMAFLFMGRKQVEALHNLQKGQSLVIGGYYTPGERYWAKLIGCFLLETK